MTSHTKDNASNQAPASAGLDVAGSRSAAIAAVPPVGAAGTLHEEPASGQGDSTSMTGGVPSASMQQAYRDVKRGLQDTDRGAEAGRVYRKLKR